MPRFEHIALTSPDQEIRLLTIEAGDEADEIRCSLSVAKLNDFPEYTAISYEWGEPEPLIDIAINRSRFSARHNLFLLLQRVRAQRMRRTTQQYWIDAICIYLDQHRNKYRRNLRFGPLFCEGFAFVYLA
jgi:Heterokaryon incompatibility protein (HET)